jgi:hypothetical protein
MRQKTGQTKTGQGKTVPFAKRLDNVEPVESPDHQPGERADPPDHQPGVDVPEQGQADPPDHQPGESADPPDHQPGVDVPEQGHGAQQAHQWPGPQGQHGPDPTEKNPYDRTLWKNEQEAMAYAKNKQESAKGGDRKTRGTDRGFGFYSGAHGPLHSNCLGKFWGGVSQRSSIAQEGAIIDRQPARSSIARRDHRLPT